MKALFLAAALAANPQPAPTPAPSTPPAGAAQPFLVERLGHDAIVRMYAPGVAELSRGDKRVAWYLSLAAHAGEEIAYDQLGWDMVALKRLLESVYLFGREGHAEPGSFDAKLADYLARFYGQTGNHDQTTGQKFVPAFTPAELEAAALRALKAGAPLGVKDEAALKTWLGGLRPSLFDAGFEPQLTSKAPPPGQDILTASANTAYGRGVTLKDLEGFQEKNPLNSRVVKVDGTLVEQVFRTGTPDGKVPRGLYAAELSRVSAHLREAAKSAPKEQKAALEKLVRYFETGDLKDWDAYNIAWLKANPTVDANLGFIETYVDARGQKGQWEALINYRDARENQVMELIARRAQAFENGMPWPDKYKRKKVATPVAKAINLVTSLPTPPAGINLPNEQHIREKYGSKSVLVANVMEAAAAMKRLPLAIEFSRTPEDAAKSRQYTVTARKWLVAFHEVMGHASGQVDPKLEGGPSRYLKEYDNTLEEARADLVALWHAFDPSLATLSPEHERIAEQMYRDYLVEGLTNLNQVPEGDVFEEDHQRGHHMTVNFLMEKGAVKQVVEGGGEGKPGRTYWAVEDYGKMRTAVGELLSKLMVIKATGDYEGIRKLVQETGIRFDPKLRDEVVARVRAVEVPADVLLISPRLVPVVDGKGQLVDVKVRHDQGFIEQHLERSVLGRLAPAEATRVAARLAETPAALAEEYRKLAP
ncbi:dipeptidyl-peptidase-3 [Archangium gephyra]|uniref:Dipeptidyl-peptidase III n=1 Tax=Archangium gephyra TaxID=48 RepID=A0AAC8TBE1_9BACT|nr:peptidase [Archangium gephyra]AKI99729.1 Dipeptidyl-peptidase III [Archangium gephyra]REG27739.1 dipeptidyl-peptidase-3 [Archangium gephyra]